MLTVLLATRNGATTLPSVLDAFGKLETPRSGWKIVIVDNGSTDTTRQVIAGFEDRLPLTYVFEPAIGKNTALNTGLAYVSGDLVVLTDDDALPRPDWIVRLRAAADLNPTFSIFGGAVLPRWETSPPRWVLNWVPLNVAYAISDSSLLEGPVEGDHIFGLNMAVRSDIFDAGHRFDPSIGPGSSRSYPMGSETEFVLRLIQEGVRAWYARTAIVDHFIRTRQLRPAWLLGRAVRFGRGQYRLDLRKTPPPPMTWLAVPPQLLRRVVRKSAELALGLFQFNAETLFRRAWGWSYVLGYTLESGAMSRERWRRGPHRAD
jgi:glycosyltransferase involved in cell wall biosynthesis